MFVHVRKLKDAKHLNAGAPNNDTLYSRSWVDLNDEPVILSVPEINDRYYTMEIVDFMGDNFAYVGVRATGTKAGSYAIIGPGWKGELPAGVVALPPSSTPRATILGRTLVKPARTGKLFMRFRTTTNSRHFLNAERQRRRFLRMPLFGKLPVPRLTRWRIGRQSISPCSRFLPLRTTP